MAEIDPSQRIVITGSGGSAPVSWEQLTANQSGITDIADTVASTYEGFGDMDVHLAAGINEDIANDPLVREHRKSVKFMHRSALMGWVGMNRALAQAQVDMSQIDPFKVGFYVGSAFSGADHFREIDLERVYPYDAFHSLISRVALAGAMEENLKGKGGLMGAECASSALAIDTGAGDLLPHYFRGELRPARADIVVVGGADAAISPNNIRSFSGSLPGAVDKSTDPAEASRPFDKNANGLVMGEAGWMLVMETWKHAQARGLRESDVVAELAGFESFTDAKSRTLAGQEGAVRAMLGALRMAGIALGETVYVNAHATSTPEGDPIEAMAIKEVIAALGLNISDFYVSSTKGATGHTMGAAGALEAYFASRAVNEDTIPANLKFVEPAAGAEGLQIPPETLFRQVDVALSNSLGFGGAVTSLAFRKFKA